jgi:hypothetical protein
MQQYNLRPVSELSRSPSSRSSGSPPNHDMSPPSSHLPPIQHPSNGTQAPIRRPISPSSLPRKPPLRSIVLSFTPTLGEPLDLDVSNGQVMPPRNYPPPPTGHDLMRLFPPQPPEQPLFLKQGSTSLYFRRQEHQFFAQAGKEIIRVRVESDFPPSGGSRTPKGKEPASVPHAWPAHAHPQPPSATMQPPPEHNTHAPAHMHSPPHPVPPYPHHHPDIARGGAPGGPVGVSGAVAPPPAGYAPSHPIVRNAPPPVSHVMSCSCCTLC